MMRGFVFFVREEAQGYPDRGIQNYEGIDRVEDWKLAPIAMVYITRGMLVLGNGI